MQEDMERLFARMRESADFADVDLYDINACATDGDNALHFAVHENDVSAARALIDAGIEINKAGDLGYTPLHVACMKGSVEIVKLLIEKGADVFALSNGYPPFTTARLANQARICDLLEPAMRKVQAKDTKIWVRARILQLRRELADLEAKLNT
jgi:ankyrin repeat protein